MDARQKFLNALQLKIGEPIPEWAFAYWYDTIERWYSKGLPIRMTLSILLDLEENIC